MTRAAAYVSQKPKRQSSGRLDPEDDESGGAESLQGGHRHLHQTGDEKEAEGERHTRNRRPSPADRPERSDPREHRDVTDRASGPWPPRAPRGGTGRRCRPGVPWREEHGRSLPAGPSPRSLVQVAGPSEEESRHGLDHLLRGRSEEKAGAPNIVDRAGDARGRASHDRGLPPALERRAVRRAGTGISRTDTGSSGSSSEAVTRRRSPATPRGIAPRRHRASRRGERKDRPDCSIESAARRVRRRPSGPVQKSRRVPRSGRADRDRSGSRRPVPDRTGSARGGVPPRNPPPGRIRPHGPLAERDPAAAEPARTSTRRPRESLALDARRARGDSRREQRGGPQQRGGSATGDRPDHRPPGNGRLTRTSSGERRTTASEKHPAVAPTARCSSSRSCARGSAPECRRF